MGLSTYQPRTAEVSIGEDNSVTVRGLSFNDVVELFEAHSEEINEAFGLISANSEEGEEAASDEQMLVQLVAMFPGLVGSIIARASGELDQVEQAKKLPFPTQLAICVDIVDLTFREVGGAKKFMAMAGAALKTVGKSGKIQVPKALNIG